MTGALPWRGEGPAAPPPPVDLHALPVARHGVLRKRWRYVGVFGERLMLCAGVVQVGPARQAFWAVWDRERGVLRERTRLVRGRRHVRLPKTAFVVRDGDVRAELALVTTGPAVQTASPAGSAGGWAWTRKQPARVRGEVLLGGERVPLDAPALVDESAGFHARETAWCWSAGAGTLVDGRAVAWTLVDGIHDDPHASERTVWVDGAPHQPPPVAFADDLGGVGDLRFAREATRARRDELVLVRSVYEQPFGAFSGRLPGGLELAAGLGVMERHAARW